MHRDRPSHRLRGKGYRSQMLVSGNLDFGLVGHLRLMCCPLFARCSSSPFRYGNRATGQQERGNRNRRNDPKKQLAAFRNSQKSPRPSEVGRLLSGGVSCRGLGGREGRRRMCVCDRIAVSHGHIHPWAGICAERGRWGQLDLTTLTRSCFRPRAGLGSAMARCLRSRSSSTMPNAHTAHTAHASVRCILTSK